MKHRLLKSLMTLCAVGLATPSFAGESNLQSILNAQPDEVKARYEYRHPSETIQFFGIKPGMTVVEALPGGGWYSKILLPVLGPEGTLVGADYQQALWPNFSWAKPEMIEKKKTWVTDWVADAQAWRDDDSASLAAFQFGALPETMHGSADAVLFIRALHNMARFEDKGGFMSGAMQDAYTALKPGGIVGIVQHEAREDRPDTWANGDAGYLKKSYIKAKMASVGFEFVAESTINENPKDTAGEGDIVWRLPPSLSGSKDDAEKRAEMQAIGESNRMTLLFKKPAK
ncbi:methyltransferase [Arenicella chitinivorans]|uniref:Methyltransferase n=1 Tax=Arenicella chitinivorans TaxID=1329800 RepID=A0A918VK84_9GAMM|nr:class I SAM-dependent methyltransferase [Arenicella chitinivorans]GHA04314.1 methyltransferase [Arenicella chitinivorans]